ncbi:MAG: hypothetical protein ABL880_09535 [Methylotenera sp.]
MATQYPLLSQAFTWPLSALYQLSRRILHSALHTYVSAPASTISTIAEDDKTIKTHNNALKHLLCKPISMRVAGQRILFSLDAQKTAANNHFYQRGASWV